MEHLIWNSTLSQGLTLAGKHPAQKLSLALFTGEDVGAPRSLCPLC